METEGPVQPVNNWKPVTELYQQMEIPVAEAPVTVSPAVLAFAKPEAQPNAEKSRVPLGIALYAWYCFLRAGLFVLMAAIVGLAPTSELALRIGEQTIPGASRMAQAARTHQDTSDDAYLDSDFEQEMRRQQQEMNGRIYSALPIFFLVGAGWFTWLGMRWWGLSSNARTIAIVTSGLFLAKVVRDLFLVQALGAGGLIDSYAMSGLYLSAGWNLIVLLYLLYHPDVVSVFARKGED